MSDDFTISVDLLCGACQYNLRGLSPDAKCPECGVPIVVTLEHPFVACLPQHDDIRRYLRTKPYMKAAEVSGCAVDAVMFVYDAVRTASWMRKQSGSVPASTPSQLSARQICDGFRAHAKWYFNDEAEARDLLNEWGLRSSEDVGKVIFAMIESGRLRASPGDLPSEFARIFTLENIFAGSDLPGLMDLATRGTEAARATGRLAKYGGITGCIGVPLIFATMCFLAIHSIAKLAYWLEILISLIVGGGLFYVFIVSDKTSGTVAARKLADGAKGQGKDQ